MVSTDSCWALPMKEQVLTTITSASSALGVSSAPARRSTPIMTSLSTRFLGQPRLTKPTLVGWRELDCSGAGAAIGSFKGMESTYSSSFPILNPDQIGTSLLLVRAATDSKFTRRVPQCKTQESPGVMSVAASPC